MEPLPPIQILIVDDRASQRRALSVVVEGLGAQVLEAASGREALRLVLQNDFAVILLDVNMPGIDGFETASIIRQRKRSEHTPIIFVTAYGDESHAARGYLLGAVDYIQSPVDSQVLRSKVSVFVELYRRTGEATRYAESLRRRAQQLRRLADLSMAVHDAGSVDALLDTVTVAAAEIMDAEQAAAETLVESASPLARTSEAGPVRHAVKKPPDAQLEVPEWLALFDSQRQVQRGPDGRLAVPLCARDGRVTGVLQVAERRSGEFDAEDEALLLQVAQIASIAIENTVFRDAQEANRLKDQFLATLSHELRTPLQAMFGWVRILQDDASDPAILARGLEVIERCTSAQQKMIDDLLDVSRIVTGKLRLEREPVALSAVARCALDEMRAGADAKGLEVHVSLDEGVPLISGDPHRLQQVIRNLLSNAITFTPAGGRVDLVLRRIDESAEIRVQDSGEGISSEFLPYVFERFRQADSSSTRAHTGLGIGLAIVRHLIELHGGSVRAESAGKGKGSAFVLELPLRGAEAGFRAAAARGASVGDGEAVDLGGLCVLLVDDVDFTRECVALMLRRRGAQVISVGSADEALAAIEVTKPDVLVSDIAMPGRDGLSLIEAVRRDVSGARIPAAALSAYARPEERERALGAGFDLHLSKPVGEETLVASVLALSRIAGERAL